MHAPPSSTGAATHCKHPSAPMLQRFKASSTTRSSWGAPLGRGGHSGPWWRFKLATWGWTGRVLWRALWGEPLGVVQIEIFLETVQTIEQFYATLLGLLALLPDTLQTPAPFGLGYQPPAARWLLCLLHHAMQRCPQEQSRPGCSDLEQQFSKFRN